MRTNVALTQRKNYNKHFLENQRKARRPGCRVRLEKVILQKEIKPASNRQLLEKGRRRSQPEKSSLFESAMLGGSPDS